MITMFIISTELVLQSFQNRIMSFSCLKPSSTVVFNPCCVSEWLPGELNKIPDILATPHLSSIRTSVSKQLGSSEGATGSNGCGCPVSRIRECGWVGTVANKECISFYRDSCPAEPWDLEWQDLPILRETRHLGFYYEGSDFSKVDK